MINYRLIFFGLGALLFFRLTASAWAVGDYELVAQQASAGAGVASSLDYDAVQVVASSSGDDTLSASADYQIDPILSDVNASAPAQCWVFYE